MHYKLPYNQYKKIKNMSQTEMSRWLEEFGKNMYDEGYKAGNEFGSGDNTIIVFDSPDDMFEHLIKIKGVGVTVAERIVISMLEKDA